MLSPFSNRLTDFFSLLLVICGLLWGHFLTQENVISFSHIRIFCLNIPYHISINIYLMCEDLKCQLTRLYTAPNLFSKYASVHFIVKESELSSSVIFFALRKIFNVLVINDFFIALWPRIWFNILLISSCFVKFNKKCIILTWVNFFDRIEWQHILNWQSDTIS